jgi:hypothetical protein
MYMKRVRALQSFTGRKKGEEFDLPDEEARILSAPDLIGGQKVAIIATEETVKRGRYNRRDLRVEE